MKKSLLIVGVLALFGAGCSQQVAQNTNTNPWQVQAQQDAAKAQAESEAYDRAHAFTATPGQKFGEMVFVNVNATNTASFTGTVQLTGKYGTSDLDGNVCFFPDTASAAKIPNLRKDTQSNFCFSNIDVAKKLLGTGEGTATITVSGFSDMTIDTSQPAYSTLVKVVSKK